jgi:hypothetical protein
VTHVDAADAVNLDTEMPVSESRADEDDVTAATWMSSQPKEHRPPNPT